MRVPYSYTYLQQTVARIEKAGIPGISVDTIGQTQEKRNLQIIRVEDKKADPKEKRPAILIYVREHATEPDGSWAADGILGWLLSDDPNAIRARQQADWLIIPILDPDAVYNAKFSNGDFFRAVEPVMPEAMTYATYIIDSWIDTEHRLDIAINLHNVECSEGPNLFCPFVNVVRKPLVQTYNKRLFEVVKASGFTVGDPLGGMEGIQGLRLMGWCYRRFHTCDITLELNTRAPGVAMNIYTIEKTGVLIAEQAYAFRMDAACNALFLDIDAFMAERTNKRIDWWKATGRSPETRNYVDIIGYGYEVSLLQEGGYGYNQA